MWGFLRASGVTVLGLVLFSCGPGRPDVADAEEYLRSLVGDGTRLRVTSFEKTDGVLAEEAGVAQYTMMFTADATFTSNAMFSIGMPLLSRGSQIEVAEYRPPSRGFSWDDFLASSQGWRVAGEGDRLSLAGEIAFQRRESGWTPTGIDFTFVHDSTTRAAGIDLTPPEDLYKALVSDLRNLAQNQLIYFADHDSYTDDLDALRFTPFPGVTLSIVATATGWSGIATHERLPPGEGCAVRYGEGVAITPGLSLPHSPSPGEVLCTQ